MLMICGVTFDHTTNYGSCFQAYALETVINSIELDGESCHYDLLPYSVWGKNIKPPKRKDIPSIIKYFIIKKLDNSRRKKFVEFENKHMNYIDLSGINDLYELNNKYDAFVCGSDVIWSFDFTDGDPVYFLSFAEKYKFSYAASFGVKNIFSDYETDEETVRKHFSQNLYKLDSIGLREKSSVEQVRTITDKPLEVVCDPVFLLKANEWSRLCSDTRIIADGQYIFVYSTYVSQNLLRFTEKLHTQTGLKVIHVTWDKKEAVKRGLFVYPTPEKWLGLLKNAAYIVTNSYHATAFCLIFHKKFFWVMKNEKVQETGIRLFDLLDSADLKERIYNNTSEKIILESPEFYVSDQFIKAEREKGLNYIRENLSAAKRIRDAEREKNDAEGAVRG